MLILITRPLEEAEALAATLKSRGIECLIEPMLAIKLIDGSMPALGGVQALLFTSANGVNAFALQERRRDLKVFAVGENTAEAAAAAGFAEIESAHGTVEELAELVKKRLDPKQGALFHGAGSVLKGDLIKLLEPDGFEVRRAMLYQAIPATAFSGTTVTALRDGRIDMVLLFSPRTAEIFVNLARSTGVDAACAGIVALCLSPAVAEASAAVRWRELRTASRPERTALLELIDAPAGAGDVQPAARNGSANGKNGGDKAGLEKDTAALAMIRAFGGIRPMASKLGVPVTTVQGWKERGHIPAARSADLRAAAAIHGINLDALDLAAATSAASEVLPNAAAANVAASNKATPSTPQPTSPTRPAPPAQAPHPDGRSAAAAAAPPPKPAPAPDSKHPSASAPADRKQANDSAAPPAPPPRRVGLTLALFALALAALAFAAGVTLPYWGPRVGIVAAAPPPSADAAGLSQRIAALEHGLDAMAHRPAPQAGAGGIGGADAAQLATLNSEISSLKAANAQLAAEAETMHRQLDALTQQVHQTGEAEAQRAALALAVGQLGAALSHAGPYDRALADVAALGEGDAEIAKALAVLKPRAALGIPTLAQLTLTYDAASIDAARAAQAPQRPGIMGAVLARLAALVVIRRTDGGGSGGPDAALARAAALLKTGDLADAVVELGALEDGPAHAIAPWLNDARDRLAAESALSALTARALSRLSASRS